MKPDDLTEEQRDLFDNISYNLRHVEALEEEIQGYRDSCKNGFHHLFGLNEADAAILSIGPKEKLRWYEERVEDGLKEAVELGMRDLDIVRDNYRKYTGESLPESGELRDSYRRMNLELVV